MLLPQPEPIWRCHSEQNAVQRSISPWGEGAPARHSGWREVAEAMIQAKIGQRKGETLRCAQRDKGWQI